MTTSSNLQEMHAAMKTPLAMALSGLRQCLTLDTHFVAIMEVEPENRTDHPAESARERFAPDIREACDRKRAHREIETIARELERPTWEIAEIYAELYADLKSRAQVTDYLPVLVARKVRARYDQ